MSRRLDRWRGRLEAELPEVVVCRGGDCGSRRKHPRFDHVGQLTRIREALEGPATVSVSKCLDACEHSNVVVVRPGRRLREVGVEPLWLGQVLDEDSTEGVVEWVRTMDSGAAPPEALLAHRFEPGSKSRYTLGTRRTTARNIGR